MHPSPVQTIIPFFILHFPSYYQNEFYKYLQNLMNNCFKYSVNTANKCIKNSVNWFDPFGDLFGEG